MQAVPPGPEWEWMRREADEDLQRLHEELLAGPPFPVYAAFEPALGDESLAGAARINGALEMVELISGDFLARQSGPMLLVRSARLVGDDEDSPYPESDLDDVLADERDRRMETTETEVEKPVRVAESAALLVVDGVPLQASIRREDRLWAARVEVSYDGPGSVLVTVVGWDVSLDEVRLGRVDNFAPYVRGQAEMIARAIEQLPRPLPSEGWRIPPAQGVEAHVAVIESSVAEAAAVRSAVEEDRRYRIARGDDDEHTRLWEAAVRAQMRFAGQSRSEADAAITSLVNHMVELSEAAPWFGDPELRRAAIDESVRYVAFDSDVPSRPAQDAWQRSWAIQSRPPSFGWPPQQDAAWSTFSTLMQRREELLTAWARWVDRARP